MEATGRAVARFVGGDWSKGEEDLEMQGKDLSNLQALFKKAGGEKAGTGHKSAFFV